MWKRRTFHECAAELEQISRRFRAAEVGTNFNDEVSRRRELLTTSTKGVEILRVLALAIRSEQDYGNIPRGERSVGALTSDIANDSYQEIIDSYSPPFLPRPGFQSLNLREALNKIAHSDISKSGYYADINDHDLILSGSYRDRNWVAIVSIPALCCEIKALPDEPIEDI